MHKLLWQGLVYRNCRLLLEGPLVLMTLVNVSCGVTEYPPTSPTQGFPQRERDDNYNKLDPATRVCAAPRINKYAHTTVRK